MPPFQHHSVYPDQIVSRRGEYKDPCFWRTPPARPGTAASDDVPCRADYPGSDGVLVVGLPHNDCGGAVSTGDRGEVGVVEDHSGQPRSGKCGPGGSGVAHSSAPTGTRHILFGVRSRLPAMVHDGV